jgi:hypothetical protein
MYAVMRAQELSLSAPISARGAGSAHLRRRKSMQKLAAAILVFASILATEPSFAKPGSHPVRGHVTKHGTYVPPHRATNPDSSKLNNWSTRGNVNPYTGKPGTKDPYKPKR